MKKIVITALLLGLSACASQHTVTRTVYVAEDPQAAYRATHGRITVIERIEETGSTSGAGAVIGGVVGGVAGHQVGKGTGKDVATAVGVVAGALAGNEIEREQSAPKVHYRVTVKLDNGATQVCNQGSVGDLLVGDHVRVDRNHAIRG